MCALFPIRITFPQAYSDSNTSVRVWKYSLPCHTMSMLQIKFDFPSKLIRYLSIVYSTYSIGGKPLEKFQVNERQGSFDYDEHRSNWRLHKNSLQTCRIYFFIILFMFIHDLRLQMKNIKIHFLILHLNRDLT